MRKKHADISAVIMKVKVLDEYSEERKAGNVLDCEAYTRGVVLLRRHFNIDFVRQHMLCTAYSW